MTAAFQNELSSFRDRVWVTRGARFAACERLDRQRYAVEIGTIVLSILTLVAPVLLLLRVYPVETHEQRLVSFLSIMASVSIIGLRALVRREDIDRGRVLDNSARELGELLDKTNTLVAIAAGTPDEIAKQLPALKARYHRVLQQYPANHRPIDNRRFRAQEATHFQLSRRSVWSLNLQWAALPFLPLLVPLFAVAIMWLVMPSTTSPAVPLCVDSTPAQSGGDNEVELDLNSATGPPDDVFDASPGLQELRSESPDSGRE